MLPNFVDQHPAYTAAGYGCTNEEPEILKDFLAKRTFDKIAAIASAGEMTYFLLLPRCNQELVAVDHSYRSLYVSYVKAALLDRLGPRKTKKLFVESTPLQIYEEITKLTIPEVLSSKVRKDYALSSLDLQSVRREWFYASEAALRQAAKKLDKLTFLHGDLSDLSGKFNLLYLSNAHEHTGRKGAPKGADFTSVTTDDSFLLVAHTFMSDYGTNPHVKTTFADWETVKDLKGFRTQWHYTLYKKKAKETPAQVVEAAEAHFSL
jgi:hypothetical protein